MRYLLPSFLIVLLISCSSYPKKHGFVNVESPLQQVKNPYFSDVSKDYVYKAAIEAFGKNFGGIFIVKKLAPNQHRVVFTTEMGNKIFDFSFHGDEFKINYVLPQLDKKILINILKTDFQVLTTEELRIRKEFKNNSNSLYETSIDSKKYYSHVTENELQQIVRVKNTKEKVEFLFSEINDNIAEHIQVIHQNFKLKITLKAL